MSYREWDFRKHSYYTEHLDESGEEWYEDFYHCPMCEKGISSDLTVYVVFDGHGHLIGVFSSETLAEKVKASRDGAWIEEREIDRALKEWSISKGYS